MTNSFAEDMQDQDFLTWFDDTILWSYFDSAYPCTRLSYTYDWADNGTEYGLLEFLVLADSIVEVAFMETTKAYIASLSK